MGNINNNDSVDNWRKKIEDQLSLIAQQLEKTQIAEYVQLLNKPKRLFFLNFWSGIARGIGIAIGVTVFSALIIIILQKIGALNLPLIGDFIAEIVKIVQAQLNYDTKYY